MNNLISLIISWSVFYFCLFVTITNIIIAMRGLKKVKYERDDFIPFVSVITCVWNEEKVIRRKIRNYLAQNYPKNKYEIIIADGGSTDKTPEICREYAKKGIIKYVRNKEHTEYKSDVLDRAIKNYAKGEIILHSDADSICEKNWIKKMAQGFKDPNTAAVAGVIHCGNYNTNLMTMLRALDTSWNHSLSAIGTYNLSNSVFLIGANYGLRKKFLKEVGYHGKDIVEDFLLSVKFISNKYKISLVEAESWQEEVESIVQYVLQRKRWYNAISHPENYRKHVNKLLKSNPEVTILSFCKMITSLPLILSFFLMFYDFRFYLTIYFLSMIPFIFTVKRFKLFKELYLWIPIYLFVNPFLWFGVIFSNLFDRLSKKTIKWRKILHKGRKFSGWILKRMEFIAEKVEKFEKI